MLALVHTNLSFAVDSCLGHSFRKYLAPGVRLHTMHNVHAMGSDGGLWLFENTLNGGFTCLERQHAGTKEWVPSQSSTTTYLKNIS